MIVPAGNIRHDTDTDTDSQAVTTRESIMGHIDSRIIFMAAFTVMIVVGVVV